MLKYLHIRDFTIVAASEMEFEAGLTALTGETGAGKSILLDAIGLVLGDRMQVSTVRDGASRAEITAQFAPGETSAVWSWLTDNDLDDGNQCMLRRIVSGDGKSRGYVNGRPVSMQMLRTVGEMLVDIHGQHEHFTLTRRHTQRTVLDGTLNNHKLLERVSQCYQRWQEAKAALSEHAERQQQRAERIDLLRFQLQEFDAVQPAQDDPEILALEYKRATNADHLRELAAGALEALEAGDYSADTSLSTALRQLRQLEETDTGVHDITEMVSTAVILVNEASAALRDFSVTIKTDPVRLAWLDERLAQLHRLAQKHQTSATQLTDVETRLRDELAQLDVSHVSLEELTRECETLWDVYLLQAKKLSGLRARYAQKFSAAVTQAMHALGMQGGGFDCEVDADSSKPVAQGINTVRFLISTNPGTKAGELSRIASGGELSRISLAIALVGSSNNRLPTLIFDEVDSGIGGAVAETVGHYLRTLGKNVQVLCVTHLPQVAAQAHQHVKVSKHVENGQTRTALATLNRTETVQEIARMLGGAKVTRKSLGHAKEMLQAVD